MRNAIEFEPNSTISVRVVYGGGMGVGGVWKREDKFLRKK